MQAHWQGFRGRSTFFRARAAAVAIQSCVRMYLARQHWLKVWADPPKPSQFLGLCSQSKADSDPLLMLSNVTTAILS